MLVMKMMVMEMMVMRMATPVVHALLHRHGGQLVMPACDTSRWCGRSEAVVVADDEPLTCMRCVWVLSTYGNTYGPAIRSLLRGKLM